MRLQKYLADCGIASRRKAEQLILDGRVGVNGEVVRTLGTQVDPLCDSVTYDHRVVRPERKKVYIMLNKPRGVVTTASDQFGRKCVLDLVDLPLRLYPVGRLDYDTEGLLLLTNDGEFANTVSHPKHQIGKTYQAVVRGVPTQEKLDKLRNGIEIDGGLTSPAQVETLGNRNGKADILITIHEGRNRQVKRMFDAVGHPVVSLKRIAVGSLNIGGLAPGQWRELTEKERKSLQKIAKGGKGSCL